VSRVTAVDWRRLSAGRRVVAQRARCADQQAQIAPQRNDAARSARVVSQDVAGVELGITAFGGWVPSDL